MVNDLDLILMPVAEPDKPRDEASCLTDFVVVNSEDRAELQRLKRLRPSAGKELSDFWNTVGTIGTIGRLNKSTRAFEYLGCRFRGGVMLPWEGP